MKRLSKETGRTYNSLFDRREKGNYGDYIEQLTYLFLLNMLKLKGVENPLRN